MRIGFFMLLTIVFIVLKLAEIGIVASWSWLWVLSPLWLPFVVIVGVVVVVFVVCLVLFKSTKITKSMIYKFLNLN
jgi:hypothetical protein